MVNRYLISIVVLVGCGFPRPQDVSPEEGPTDAAPDSPTDSPELDPGSVAPKPSCERLAPSCGPNHNDNCCRSPVVEGGIFYRNYDKVGDSASGTLDYPATINTFRLDKYEVTVGRFRAFVEAGMGTQANPPALNAGSHRAIGGSGWDPNWNSKLAASKDDLLSALKCDALSPWTDAPLDREQRPIGCVTWYEAMAFCAWDGGFVPTEAEWNYAGAGGGEQRGYPWSVPPDSLPIDDTYASYNGAPVSDVGAHPLGNGKWGQADLAGNVSEWTLDFIGNPVTPCVDCVLMPISTTTQHAQRGGRSAFSSINLRARYRLYYTGEARLSGWGFRCGRRPV